MKTVLAVPSLASSGKPIEIPNRQEIRLPSFKEDMIPTSKPSRGGIVSSSYETQSASLISHDQECHKATDIWMKLIVNINPIT